MNKVILIGRLTADPNTTVGNDYSISNFTLAVNRPYKNKDGKNETDFIRCTAYNHLSKLISQYARKGKLIAVVGEWRTGSYTRPDGVTVYTNDCRVTDINLLPDGSNASPTHPQSSSAPVLGSRTGHSMAVEPQQLSIPDTPVVPQATQSPISPEPTSQDVIPQAFDANIDVSDEFPW